MSEESKTWTEKEVQGLVDQAIIDVFGDNDDEMLWTRKEIEDIVEETVGGVGAKGKIVGTKHLVAAALGLAAGLIGFSGHDGWGWCLFLVALIELDMIRTGLREALK